MNTIDLNHQMAEYMMLCHLLYFVNTSYTFIHAKYKQNVHTLVNWTASLRFFGRLSVRVTPVLLADPQT